jgi:cyclic-di-GMP phosphodiesterase TipF (flagellum assembly factor)
MEIGGSGRIIAATGRRRPAPVSWGGKRMRLGTFFIAVCMVLIASSAGALLYLAFGFNAAEAVTVALMVLTALGIYNLVAAQLRASGRLGGQVFELARGSADLARQVAEMGRRLATIEKAKASPERSHTAADPLAAEIDELGALIKQLADTVAIHETTLAELGRLTSTPVPYERPVETSAAPIASAEAAAPAPRSDPMPAAAAAATADKLQE